MLEVSIPIAYELLAQCIKQGQALVQRASLVGDFSDYESWKAARKQWIDPTTQALQHMYAGEREARDFADTVICAEGTKRWQDQYAADLDCVKSAIDLLTLLQGELAFDAHRPAPAEQALGSPGERDAPALAPAAHEQPGDERREREQLEREQQRSPPSERELETADVTDMADLTDLATADHGNHDERSPSAPTDGGREADDVHMPAERIGESPPRAVGSELAARAPLLGAQLAAQHDDSPLAERVETSMPQPTRARKVLLAHGRDDRWAQAVAHLLEQAGSHELTILDQRAEQRAELLEDAGDQRAAPRYAVVLLTADDIGGRRLESAEEPYFAPRARQDVVFEMGFLAAALTPACVCVLYEEGVELPCELDEISHVRLDLAGTWQPKLLMKLRRAGFDYDLNRLVSA
jgi:predicted nucleotide-binding protein